MIVVLVLVLATVVLAPLAQRVSVPYPAVLLAFGMLLAAVPGLPIPEPNPEWILPLVLPPLLFAAARRTSWRQFLDNRRAIGLLAVALVAVTAFVVGVVLSAVVPGLPLLAGVAVAAAIAPPDPVAATAVAQKLRLPRRLRTILEGEGLSNDATALVLYDVAIAATLTGAFSAGHAATELGLAVVIGVAVGVAMAFVARRLLTALPAHPAGSALVLVVPFAAYAAADVAHGSGVLAVVTVALGLSRYGDVESSQTRLATGATWEILELLITGVAFAFVGLEIRSVASNVTGPLSTALVQALVVTAVVIVLRFAWIFPVAAVDERLRRRKGVGAEPVGWREMTVASWSGMRGVVTLAAVLALPVAPTPFPERERLIFIAFVVIAVTMLVQGMTLPLVVKWLGVKASDDEIAGEEQDLIRRARQAGNERLDELRDAGDIPADVIDHADENADRMWHSLGFKPEEHSAEEAERTVDHAFTANAVKDQMLAAAREEIVTARTESGVDPVLVDVVLRRLDARGTQPE
ncbi:Na+/H+ antiporter [Mycolicibacterium arenosum]|uniref:Na+/H+ antiporter n=1 Tax=Mycolicibacterium arenosum TaxID=2952157 RepID=A0ABT1M4W6_9MYCO|nr:Na+/H+ antiporter [Mycolicibacterium sp. CAU 1645]MCP9274208.1 Na+/H+ antiporter [Mycolicibacterium sp. CAU 1645]